MVVTKKWKTLKWSKKLNPVFFTLTLPSWFNNLFVWWSVLEPNPEFLYSITLFLNRLTMRIFIKPKWYMIMRRNERKFSIIQFLTSNSCNHLHSIQKLHQGRIKFNFLNFIACWLKSWEKANYNCFKAFLVYRLFQFVDFLT